LVFRNAPRLWSFSSDLSGDLPFVLDEGHAHPAVRYAATVEKLSRGSSATNCD